MSIGALVQVGDGLYELVLVLVCPGGCVTICSDISGIS